ncbi:toll/interleukin-1 receptor domain-containing protein [Aeromonas veronii]|uniref:toll/interleukin-1 receptor domain-containing protein n=1 Tax=Aeromonas veronii TaxID=654 RepID=UPI00217D09F6|nr:toll/interleukin-1 receptor domain-containing protein [Aeromonas veronii]UWH30054.1 toll/interleukin-1 receptor domain-containing protein [Aeromonas veronii]
MKVFLSWSGERSKQVATLLDEWLRCVLQAIRPWISTKDIDRGALWFSEIQDQLQDTTIGIICLTQENKDRPWILFEAGALAKGLSNSRVCTLLIDLQPSDIKDPLAQLNHTLPERENMFELVRTLNNRLGTNALDPRILGTVFDTYWEQFEQKFIDILSKTVTQEAPEPRSEQDILSEILGITRSLSNRVGAIENITSSSSLMSTESTSAQLKFSDKALGTLNPNSKIHLGRPAEIMKLISLYKAGKSIDEISDILKVPPSIIMGTLAVYDGQISINDVNAG